jgi:alcohol dehydrogenase
MRAIVLRDRLAFDPNYPKPDLAEGEAIIRVTRAGICNTDLELVKGYMGFRGVLGHEFVGTVVELDKVTHSNIAIGDRIVGEINCVACDSSSRDWFARAQDPQRNTLGIDRRDGAFADFVRVPIANLHCVSESVSDDEAVFVEPLAAACQILEQVHVKSTDRVFVLGDGKLGLLCAQVLATTSCKLIAVGKHDNKLDVLRQRGISTIHLSDFLKTPKASRQANIVVECTGSANGFDTARQILKPRGTLVLKSTYEGLPQANLTQIVVDEIAVVGSRCGPFTTALRMLEEKRVDVKPLIHARYPLDQGLQAFEHARQKGALKVLIDIS